MTHTVLVVEDEPNIVLSLQFILRQAGFTVRVARDGDQALRAITVGSFTNSEDRK